MISFFNVKIAVAGKIGLHYLTPLVYTNLIMSSIFVSCLYNKMFRNIYKNLIRYKNSYNTIFF